MAVLSMDAYHIRNEVLEAKGLKQSKGNKRWRFLCLFFPPLSLLRIQSPFRIVACNFLVTLLPSLPS